jgi:hypothetical protein
VAAIFLLLLFFNTLITLLVRFLLGVKLVEPPIQFLNVKPSKNSILTPSPNKLAADPENSLKIIFNNLNAS